MNQTDHPKENRILVVDDKMPHRRFIGDVLRSEGYEVLEAENGEQALERLQEQPDIRLVVLDQEMPRLSGSELLKRMRRQPAFRDLPAVFITAYADNEEVRKFRAQGVTVLEKPLSDYHEIVEAVKETLNEH